MSSLSVALRGVCLSVDHNREPYKTAGRIETLFGVHVDSCLGGKESSMRGAH